ncbi:MAG: ATPase [Bacteroidota bacterium]
MERADRVINLFEIKFYNTEFVFTAAYAEQLRKRPHLFGQLSKTKNHLMLVMITTFGLKDIQPSLGVVEKIPTLEDLFLT